MLPGAYGAGTSSVWAQVFTVAPAAASSRDGSSGRSVEALTASGSTRRSDHFAFFTLRQLTETCGLRPGSATWLAEQLTYGRRISRAWDSASLRTLLVCGEKRLTMPS